MKEFITRNFLGIIIIILGTLIYFQRCNTKIEPQKPEVKTETVYVQQPPVYIPQYVPVPHNVQTPVIIPPSYQPSTNLDSLLKQYNQLATKFLEVKTYKDSIELKDTSGKKVGIVNIEDVISENTLKSRKPSYQLNFPVTTITITNPPKLKNQIYVGGGILGNQKDFVNGGKIGLYLKNRKDQMYGISAHAVTNYPVIYSLEAYWKIKLKK